MNTQAEPRWARLLLVIDLAGTAVFAAEGAAKALHTGLDLLGFLALAIVTAVGGGIVRDLLLGDTPPSSVRDWRYLFTAVIAGGAVFLLHSVIHFENSWVVNLLDAAGLSFFAVAGAEKAVRFHLHPLLATVMGGITAVGGGTIRDILANQVPAVLRTDVYATAALCGAAVTVICLRLKINPTTASILGIVCCFVLRVLAIRYHWNLPSAVPPKPVG